MKALLAVLIGLGALAPTALATKVTVRVDYAGGPAPGYVFEAPRVPVRVERAVHVVMRGRTNDYGSFRINLAPARYTITASYGFAPYRACASRLIVVKRAPVFIKLTCSMK